MLRLNFKVKSYEYYGNIYSMLQISQISVEIVMRVRLLLITQHHIYQPVQLIILHHNSNRAGEIWLFSYILTSSIAYRFVFRPMR